MESIVVKSNGEKIDGKIVRYINYKNENYIIFTLKEIDKENYQKLYINKIVDNEEEVIMDLEWEDLKKEIPTIVKEIKNNNMVDVIDLDIDSIDTIDMKYSRAFKLKEKIVKSIINQKTSDTIKQIDDDLKSITEEVEDLENNDGNVAETSESEKTDVEIPVNPKEEKKEENLGDSEEKKSSTDNLENKVVELEEKVKKYEEIIEKIKIMINES